MSVCYGPDARRPHGDELRADQPGGRREAAERHLQPGAASTWRSCRRSTHRRSRTPTTTAPTRCAASSTTQPRCRGGPERATAVIDVPSRASHQRDLPAVRRSAVASQLGEALRARGLVVVEQVGRSGFRVDLAVRRPEDDEHRVAVLIDGADRIASQPVPERVLGHPGVLRATGWRVVHVLTRTGSSDPKRSSRRSSGRSRRMVTGTPRRRPRSATSSSARRPRSPRRGWKLPHRSWIRA